jgi:hypothetical protein
MHAGGRCDSLTNIQSQENSVNIRRTIVSMMVAAAVFAQQRPVDPKNIYHRLIAITPLVGSGSALDPTRPKYAPWPLPAPTMSTATPITPAMLQQQAGIIAFSYLPSDDGQFAIVEFVARSRAAFQPIFADSTIPTFEKGQVSKSVIETALQKYRKGFSLDTFGTVMP